MAKASERDRYEYGVCINRNKDGKPCPKCESKEVQKIRKGQDFICEECKEPMRKVPPPKSSAPMGMIKGIIVAAVIVLGLGAYLLISNIGKDKALTSTVTAPENPTVQVGDTVKQMVKTEPEPKLQPEEQSKPLAGKDISKPTKPKPTDRWTKTYSFGRYEGDLRNGIPDGQGTMYYTCRIQIAKHGRTTYYAEAGDTFVGTWGNGDIVNGNLYDRKNNQKAAILAGKRPNPYDLTKDKCE